MFKKTAIALAVATVAAVPLAQADTGPTLYGRLDMAWRFSDAGGDADTIADLNGSLSRFGIMGDEDLGGGTSIFYKMEFKVLADDTTVSDQQRLSYIGIKGGFGSFSAGRQWSAYYNNVGTFTDPTEVVGTAYLSTYVDRISNIFKYSNSFGPVSLEADVQSDTGGNDNTVDRYTFGGTFTAGPVAVGLGYDNIKGTTDTSPVIEDVTTTGIAGSVKIGSMVSLDLGYEIADDNSANKEKAINGRVNLTFGGGWSTMIGYGVAKDDDEDLYGTTDLKEDKVTWFQVNKEISKKTRTYFEYRSDSYTVADGATAQEDTSLYLIALSTNF
ncbi:MAG: porin [Gammaproteobacteria bacterium]|nr:porin [Gammaproteobacteria bacterium]